MNNEQTSNVYDKNRTNRTRHDEEESGGSKIHVTVPEKKYI